LPLASVSLEKAEVALDVPVREVTAEYACEMQATKEQAARTIDELRRSAL
jgi:hypothetical protein